MDISPRLLYNAFVVIQQIDNVTYKLREKQDFSWLKQFGEVFSVVDETGSGCICFGIRKDNKDYFYKIAGAKTVESELSESESISLLKHSIQIYKDLSHENLIKLVDDFEYNEFYIAVFEYAYGECLFDHWNFEKYKKDPSIVTPKQRFNSLSKEKKLDVVSKLFSFFINTIDKGYLAVDFYDSSIIYNFDDESVSFCDIDLFRKAPTINDKGIDYYGTKRLKAPEENVLNAVIDERTNELTLAAIIFDMFSNVSNTKLRKEKGMFIPNDFQEFELSKDVYDVLIKATSYNPDNRYPTIRKFKEEFNKAIINS